MWEKLRTLRDKVADRRIASLFDTDPGRFEAFSAACGDMVLDYSKTNLDAETRGALLDVIADRGLAARRAAMFDGAPINETEDRAVLHTALRAVSDGAVLVSGEDVMPQLRATREALFAFAETIRAGSWSAVVNIGIGGSDLGPAMAVRALRPFHDGPPVHFVSNVDGADITDTLAGLDPGSTLIIVASKTFGTIETMTNAETAKAWMLAGGGDPTRQFVALSSNEDRAAAFGIPAERVFGFADWVGGRYSLWGPIGLSLLIAIGAEAFMAFLRGGEAMDTHFRTAPFEQNLPVVLAMVGLWHNQVCDYATRAVLPYDQRLARLPDYLQQLEMESNGKSVAMDGRRFDGATGPVVWGAAGTNGQHAFYQLLHQGTQIVPCEFLVAAQGHEPDLRHHHQLLVANCLAQSEALMRGRDLDQARASLGARFAGAEVERQAKHRVFEGNRPSTTLIYPRLTPYTLGQIIALYEHRVFVEGVVLGLNSFDQWGVELGKEMATTLQPAVQGQGGAPGMSGSTVALLDQLKAWCDR